MNGDGRHTSSITINVAGNPQIISNGHHDGPHHQPHPSSPSYSPLPSPTSSPAVTMVTIPGSLQEAGSEEEHIVATSSTNRTPHFQICISRVPNTGVNISLKVCYHGNGSRCVSGCIYVPREHVWDSPLS